MELVSSSFNDSILHKRVEDNASCNVIFKNGAMGLLDATFTSPLMSVFELAVYGTDGASDADYGIDAAIDLVKFMTAAYQSNREQGKRVAIS